MLSAGLDQLSFFPYVMNVWFLICDRARYRQPSSIGIHDAHFPHVIDAHSFVPSFLRPLDLFRLVDFYRIPKRYPANQNAWSYSHESHWMSLRQNAEKDSPVVYFSPRTYRRSTSKQLTKKRKCVQRLFKMPRIMRGSPFRSTFTSTSLSIVYVPCVSTPSFVHHIPYFLICTPGNDS